MEEGILIKNDVRPHVQQIQYAIVCAISFSKELKHRKDAIE